jgi:hypothetical protein
MPSKNLFFRPARAKMRNFGGGKPPPNPHRVTRVLECLMVRHTLQAMDLTFGCSLSVIDTNRSIICLSTLARFVAARAVRPEWYRRRTRRNAESVHIPPCPGHSLAGVTTIMFLCLVEHTWIAVKPSLAERCLSPRYTCTQTVSQPVTEFLVMKCEVPA